MALWTPAQITTALWLDASDASTITLNGSTVSQWANKSGATANFSQGTAANQPALTSGGLNGLDIITFDGTADYLYNPTISLPQPVSIITVAKTNTNTGTTGSRQYVYDGWVENDTYRNLLALRGNQVNKPSIFADAWLAHTASASTSFQIFLGIFNGNSSSVGVNGSIVNGAAGLQSMTSGMALGVNFGAFADWLNGSIAEIVVVAGVVGTDTRQLIEGYLAWKWGMVGSLAADHPYKSAAPTIPDTSELFAHLTQPYSLIGDLIRSILDQTYHITNRQLAVLIQVYGMQLLAVLAQHYGDVPVVLRYLTQYYGSSAELKKALLQKYGDSPLVSSYLKQSYKVFDFLTSSLVQKYPILGESILASLTQGYAIKDLNSLTAALRQQYSVLSDRSGESSSFLVKISGAEIQCSGFKVQHSLLEYCLSCEITVNDETAWENIGVYDPIEIQIKDDTYHLIVVEKSKNEVAGTWRYAVAGRSGSVILDFPHAAEIKDNNLVSGLCSEVVNSIAAIKGKNITWEIPANESVTSNDVQISGNSPLSGIKAIVNEFGGIVQTYPSGVIKALPMRPVNTNLYNTVVPDIEINVLSATSGFNSTTEKRSGYNKYFISNKANSGGYRLSAKEINDQTYNITASIVPWADKLVTLSTSELTNAIIIPAGIVEEELTEEIEIKNGIGNLAEPCYGILSYDYSTRVNLGAVSFNEDGSVSVASGNSIVTIKYKTKHWLWVAKDIDPETVQFILVS